MMTMSLLGGRTYATLGACHHLLTSDQAVTLAQAKKFASDVMMLGQEVQRLKSRDYGSQIGCGLHLGFALGWSGWVLLGGMGFSAGGVGRRV